MPKAAQVLSVQEVELAERLVAAVTPAPWTSSMHEFGQSTFDDEYGIYPPPGEAGPVALVPGKDIADGLVWLRNNAGGLLAAAKIVRISVCTKCGWSGIPNVFPVAHQTFPHHTDLQFGCGREGCGYQVSPPLSAIVDSLTLERDQLRRSCEAWRETLRTWISEILLEDVPADIDEWRLARVGERIRAMNAPTPLIIHCPNCHMQHVDVDDDTGAWATARLHRTHLCKPSDGGCGHKFKPANQATVGVRELPEPVNG